MRKISLKHLRLENFKGIRSFETDLGDITVFRGANATGKTTMLDGVSWVLFGKDSFGRSDFQIRPVDKDGQMIDNVEIMVEATLLVGDEIVTLTKTQRQKWVKHRGSSEQKFEGNETVYQVNGFPSSQKEYTAKVSEIMDEYLFRIMANPKTFASLKWQDQRAILMRFVSEITDADVLATNPEKYSLIETDVMLGGIDRAKEKHSNILKKLKEEQKTFPVRIDEASKLLVSEDVDEAIKDKADATAELEAIAKQRYDLSGQFSEINRIKDAMVEKRLRIAEIERQAESERYAKRKADQDAYWKAKAELDKSGRNIERTKDAIATIEESIADNEAKIQSLVEKWREVNSRIFPEDEACCPTCGRRFEDEKVEELKAEFQKKLETERERISSQGSTLRTSVSDMKHKVIAMKQELTGMQEAYAAETDRVNFLHETMNAPAYVNEPNKEVGDLQAEIDELAKKLATMEDGTARRAELDAREKQWRDEITRCDAIIAAVEGNKRVRERIKDLKEQQMDCNQKVADEEQIVFLLEEFSKAKMHMLSEVINSKFKKVRFRLWTEQINGGVKETCVMQINSNGSYVDYPNANNAAQILGGLDVIDALSELYGISVPVFVDNSECLDSETTPKVNSQLVLLRVTDDPVLTVKGE